jgi:hypothetical protein
MHSIDRTLNNKGDTMSLQKAREIAKVNNKDWYIVLHEGDLQVTRLVVADQLQFVRVVNDDHAVLRFTSILDAQEFLKNELSVPRAAVYIE